MYRISTLLGSLLALAWVPTLTGEVEFRIDASYGDTSKVEFPILISLHDKNRTPIKGAIVALKRLGPSGWTEEEIVREAESRTDRNGMIVVMYRGTTTRTAPSVLSVEIYGAVTVLAEGHQTVTIELRDKFKDGRYTLSESTVPHLNLELPDRTEESSTQQKEAQQAVDGNPH